MEWCAVEDCFPYAVSGSEHQSYSCGEVRELTQAQTWL